MVALAAIVVAQASSAPAAKQAKGNPLGVTVIRFAKGTTDAQMRSAVSTAGGEVVTDIAQLGTITATSSSSGFATAVKKDKSVTSVFADTLVPLSRVDVAAAGSAAGNVGLGGNSAQSPPDPWHNLGSFLGETNPEGILQWDDNRMNVPAAWATTTGDHALKIAVLDTGVQGSHKELKANYDNQDSANLVPCNLLTRQFGPGLGQRDCSSEDTEGHGTWVASRIAGAANGFASNGVAPNVQVAGYKVLSTTLGGGLTSWIVAGMVKACDDGADIINMSLGGYDDPVADSGDFLLWLAGVNYCRAKGTAIFASAGNDHVRINRVAMSVGGQALTNVGQVDTGNEGIGETAPGTPALDRRGLLETPAGVPGVVMVSATNNAIPNAAGTGAVNYWTTHVGARDQLTYYSSYGSRIDVSAPGGARKFNVPRYDGGNGDILYGGWGTLGALDASGQICTDPSLASILTFTCFKVDGQGFGWLQGTSMSSPNATGVAALALSAHANLRKNPDALLAKLQATARTDMTNYMGPNDPANTSAGVNGTPCSTGFCHVDFTHPLSFSDAYGAGIVNAAAAVQ
jgi:subtilisin family serine protease